MNVREQLELLGEVAEGQWGMFTSAQARRRGVTRVQLQRATESGNLERLAHGVYRITGAPAEPYESLRAAWLAIEPARTVEERLNDPQPSAVVCGSAAAWLHGLGDLDPVPYDIATTVRTRPRREDVRTATRQLQHGDVTIRHGLPVTTVERTVADLILDDTDDGHLIAIVGDARTLDTGKVDRYIDQAPVRRRAKARAKFRKIPAARAKSLLGDLQITSPEVREQVLLAMRPALEQMSAAVRAQSAEAMKPTLESIAETQRPFVESVVTQMNPFAAQASADRDDGRCQHPYRQTDVQDRPGTGC